MDFRRPACLALWRGGGSELESLTEQPWQGNRAGQMVSGHFCLWEHGVRESTEAEGVAGTKAALRTRQEGGRQRQSCSDHLRECVHVFVSVCLRARVHPCVLACLHTPCSTCTHVCHMCTFVHVPRVHVSMCVPVHVSLCVCICTCVCRGSGTAHCVLCTPHSFLPQLHLETKGTENMDAPASRGLGCTDVTTPEFLSLLAGGKSREPGSHRARFSCDFFHLRGAHKYWCGSLESQPSFLKEKKKGLLNLYLLCSVNSRANTSSLGLCVPVATRKTPWCPWSLGVSASVVALTTPWCP